MKFRRNRSHPGPGHFENEMRESLSEGGNFRWRGKKAGQGRWFTDQVLNDEMSTGRGLGRVSCLHSKPRVVDCHRPFPAKEGSSGVPRSSCLRAAGSQVQSKVGPDCVIGSVLWGVLLSPFPRGLAPVEGRAGSLPEQHTCRARRPAQRWEPSP